MSAKPATPVLKISETRINRADDLDAGLEDIYPDTGEVQVRLFPKEQAQPQGPDCSEPKKPQRVGALNCAPDLYSDPGADSDPDPDHPVRVESPRQNLAEPPESDPFPNFPSELKKKPNFVRWNLERDGDGRLTKVPYQAKDYTPTTRHVASSTNPSTWASFAEVCRSLQETGAKISQTHGIGFALGKKGCGFTVVDLDGCRNPKTGEIADWALDFIAAHLTYYEISPSGFGFHGVFLGQPILPNGK